MRQLRDIDEVRELLRAEADLLVVMREYGVEPTNVGSSHVKICCPFHEEQDPSFHANLTKQVWYCHGACKRGGDVFTFVQEMEHLSHVETLYRLADLVGFDLAPYLREPTAEEKEQQALFDLNSAVWESLPSARRHPWRATRRLDVQVLEEFGVRHSVSLPKVPGDQGYLKALGLGPKDKWRWQDVIVIPMIDASGRIAGFRNRLVEPRKGLKVFGPTEGHPLPLPPILGLREARKAIREAGYVILVEGEVDWLQMVGYGWENTGCLMSSNFGEAHLTYLEELGISMVVLLPDGDKAGREMARRVATTRRKSRIAVKIAMLEEGDPDETLLTDPDLITQAVVNARYSFEYLIDTILEDHEIGTISGKMDALADLREYFTSAPEHERDLAIRELAVRLDMDRDAILDYIRESPVDQQTIQLQNVRAERIVLASMLDDDEFAGDAMLGLRAEHFWLARHKRIFETIRVLYTTHDAVTRGTVETYVRNRGDEKLAQYVHQLKGDPAEREYMLKDVRDKAIRRIAIDQTRDAIARLSDPSVDAKISAQRLSAGIAQTVIGGGQVLRSADLVVRDRMVTMMERIREPDAIVGLDMGAEWQTLNLTLHGFRSKRLMILGAASTVGKTAVALCWSRRVAVDLGEPVLYMSFETDEETMMDRLIAQISGVETDKLITGFMTKEEVVAAQEAAALIARSPLVFTQKGRTLQEAATIIRHDVLKRGTKLVVVDYLQLMRVEGYRDRRDLELGEISSQLLAMSRELDTRIVAQAQLNRQGARAEHQSKEDVGDSYRLAQDADEFLILRMKSREEMEEDGPQKGTRHGFLDKNRGGRRGVGFSVIADENVMSFKEAR